MINHSRSLGDSESLSRDECHNTDFASINNREGLRIL